MKTNRSWFYNYKKIFTMVSLIIIYFAILQMPLGESAANNVIYKVAEKDGVTVYVDMRSVAFHKLDEKIAIEYTTIQVNERKGQVYKMRIYTFPMTSKFRNISFESYDIKSQILLDRDTQPTDFQSYSDTSPVQICINFIINNYEKYREGKL